MPDSKHNQPPVLVELDNELADFLVENMEANLRLSLTMLSSAASMAPENVVKLVGYIEKFRKIKKAVEASKK